MLPVTILRQSHQSQLAPDGSVQRIVRIDFKVGADGPFNLSIGENDFTVDEMVRQVQAFANNIEAVRAKLSTPR
jgi:hypothetical protein